MSNAATWNHETSGVAAAEHRAAFPRAVLVSAAILLVTAALSGGLYFQWKQGLHKQTAQPELREGSGASEANSELLRGVNHIAALLAGIALTGGVGCLVAFYTGVRRFRVRLEDQLQKVEECQRTTATLQAQLAEARRAKDSILVDQTQQEDKMKELTAENARLAEELDKRNRAEKALTQKRQELESSKSVLELHVQARTLELQSLQRRYEMILNSAGEGICGLDVEGKATFINPAVAKLTGWAIDELIGKREHEIFRSSAQKEQTPSSGQNLDERVLFRKDGTRFPVELVKTPINENGRVVGSVVVFKDITERKQVEDTLARKAAELARSNSELEQFAFVASHDLQEPLRKIQAFGDRLKVKCEPIQAPEIQDYLGRMQGAAARMRTLINDLLAFSRVIRSSEPFVPVDLGVVTREVLVDLEVRIEKSSAKVVLGNLPTIEADPMQMRQLMLNLIGNALKFQRPGAKPVVKIKAAILKPLSGQQQCELRVEDNGIGFDEKYMDKIFAVFQRLHGRTEYEGTGVGLAVCRRIVDRHHGSIVAKSQSGQGATFIVTLPLHQATPQPNA